MIPAQAMRDVMWSCRIMVCCQLLRTTVACGKWWVERFPVTCAIAVRLSGLSWIRAWWTTIASGILRLSGHPRVAGGRESRENARCTFPAQLEVGLPGRGDHWLPDNWAVNADVSSLANTGSGSPTLSDRRGSSSGSFSRCQRSFSIR